jgi:tRNA (mo5U34)-methyltransferase
MSAQSSSAALQPDMDHSQPAQALREAVDSQPFWYHKIALPNGVVTPGWAPLDARSYGIPDDLSGKRVLDVGAWDGYWSFEALKRGAREVVAIDDFSDYLGSLEKRDRPGWLTFDLCRDALGYGDDVCQRIEMSVYDVSEERLGRFDVVFCFGVLYHLRHPLLALDCLASVCDESLHVESAILDDFSPYRGGLGQGYSGGQMVMEFYPDNQYGNNHTNWWTPTIQCLGHMVRSAGFQKVDGWKLVDGLPAQLSLCRGFVRGTQPSIAQG